MLKANDGGQVRTANGKLTLFIVRNADKWRRASASELAQHYNSTRVYKDRLQIIQESSQRTAAQQEIANHEFDEGRKAEAAPPPPASHSHNITRRRRT